MNAWNNSSATNMPAAQRIAIAGANDYAAMDIVRRTMARIPNDATIILTAFCGINRVAREVAQSRQLSIIQLTNGKVGGWNCKPNVVMEASPSAIVIFYDPSNPYLLDLARAAYLAGIPVAILDGTGKSLDYREKLCATIPAGGRNRMPVIDQAVDNVRSAFSTKVKSSITLPENVYQKYEDQAKAEHQPVEKVMEDRLRRCADYTASKPLYFNDNQRNELERITGGHVLNSPDAALTHIRTTCQVKIDDVDITFPPRVLQRAAARAKCARMSTEEWLEREIQQNMERSVGLRPW